MGRYRVDATYADEAGIVVRAGEIVEMTAADAKHGVERGRLVPLDRPRVRHGKHGAALTSDVEWKPDDEQAGE